MRHLRIVLTCAGGWAALTVACYAAVEWQLKRLDVVLEHLDRNDTEGRLS